MVIPARIKRQPIYGHPPQCEAMISGRHRQDSGLEYLLRSFQSEGPPK
jgi:hypothetical protein